MMSSRYSWLQSSCSAEQEGVTQRVRLQVLPACYCLRPRLPQAHKAGKCARNAGTVKRNPCSVCAACEAWFNNCETL
eukprot:3559256-Amphidinium_carterae.1